MKSATSRSKGWNEVVKRTGLAEVRTCTAPEGTTPKCGVVTLCPKAELQSEAFELLVGVEVGRIDVLLIQELVGTGTIDLPVAVLLLTEFNVVVGSNQADLGAGFQFSGFTHRVAVVGLYGFDVYHGIVVAA